MGDTSRPRSSSDIQHDGVSPRAGKKPKTAPQSDDVVVYQGQSGLEQVPYEVMGLIAKDLEIGDIFNLSLCSEHLQYLVHEDRFCRAILTGKAPYALETLEAQKTDSGYGRALRRLIKRRCATSQAYPYVIGIVGFANSYAYHNGVLCYVVEARPKRWLRFLDLRNSASAELVVDIPTLVSKSVLGTKKATKYKFRILHHAEGITACLLAYAFAETESWLLVFKAGEQTILEPLKLESVNRVFVRNNADFLYVGTHSEDGGGDGHRRWVLRSLSIKDNTWFPKKIHLLNLVGYEIGSTVCFEIIDGYFYGLSNLTSFVADSMAWTSCYYCFRFPLDRPGAKEAHYMQRQHSWRRHHSEGPIDDRWGFLKLERDETGRVIIVESRKEWLQRSTGSRRTYYTKEVIFPEDGGEDWLPANLDENPHNDQAGSSNQPKIPVVHPRSPHDVHPECDSSTNLVYLRSQIQFSSYQRSSSTFFDLINTASTDQPGVQRLQIWAGTRTLRSPFPPYPTNHPPIPEDQLSIQEHIDILYHPTQISMWPPELSGSDQRLDEVYGILNPPGYQGTINATSDDRSLVYSTGGDSKEPKPLVYLSFDPSAKLYGMRRWGRLSPEHVGGGLQRGNDSPMYKLGGTAGQLSGLLAETKIEGKGKEREHDVNLAHALQPHGIDIPLEEGPLPAVPPRGDGNPPWAWYERPRYRDEPGKLSFHEARPAHKPA